MLPDTGQSRLVASCAAGDVATATATLRDGADVNAAASDDSGAWHTPLLAAVAHRRTALVVHLLSHGADPNGSDAVAVAAASGTPAILAALVCAGGDVNGV